MECAFWRDVFQLLVDLDDAGITDIVPGNDDDRVYVRPMSRITTDLAHRIKELKPALIKAMTPIRLGADGWPVDSVPADWTCPACGGIRPWWDGLGRQRCMHCERDAFERARRWAETAAAIRAKKTQRRLGD